MVNKSFKSKRSRLRSDEGNEDQTLDGQQRIYGDVDEDLDREELAKEVNVKLEREKQKKINFETVVDDREGNSQEGQGHRPTKQQNAGINN